MDFIQETPYERMVDAAGKIILVDGDSRPTPDQIKECERFADLSVGEQRLDDWYCLLRHAQGRPRAYTAGGLRYMIDNRDFLADSLFCEWAYIINLDDKVLEIYRGFQKRKDHNPRNRYRDMKQAEEKYYPVALIAEFSLDSIPDNWVDTVYKKAKEERWYKAKIEPLSKGGQIIYRWVEIVSPEKPWKEKLILPVEENLLGVTPAKAAEAVLLNAVQKNPRLKKKLARKVFWADLIDAVAKISRHYVLTNGVLI
ncbi:hypothetical protein SDD30_13170 [Moorella naiadis]|uniref:hypothetical protein n=1 Tax=Moorella naiadis (nom. illeg.) TaxID=3093670 RepID=UPI003D9CBC37